MKLVSSLIPIIHDIIHVMGFVKAFSLTNISQHALGIPKPVGSLWLITFILFYSVQCNF